MNATPPPPPDPSQRPERDRPLTNSSYVTTLAHFYRGEMGRIMVWRTRLDTTTTWAITSTTTIFTIAFSFRDVPHVIFFFNVCIVGIMLWIEARRYRIYDAFRARVRMLEAHFLVPVVSQNTRMLHGEWEKLVCEDLLLPSYKLSMLEAVGRRLKRNYVFIFGIILVAWITKIFLHSPVRITSFERFYHALAVDSLPSWAVAALLVLTYGTVISIIIYMARKTSGEVSEFGGHRSAWRI